MSNDELLELIMSLSQEHFDTVEKMVEEMNAHSTKKVAYRLAVA